MQPKKISETPDLFKARLDQIINANHPLCILSNQIDWASFEEQFDSSYVENWGRPGNPIRLMVGLHYLKHTFNESDESVIARFLENPYWQYFCGFDYFQHELPIDSSSLTRFRQRIGESGVEQLFKALLTTAQRTGSLKKSHLNKVNVDTTVQEKAIAFPTDARLYYKMREKLVGAAKSQRITLRQSYTRIAKKALLQQGCYARAKQYQRARKMTKKLKTMLGRVYRDIQRRVPTPDEEFTELLQLANRLLHQQKDSKNKLYSIHAPEVECISKGKAHKRYEFGVKVGMATTSRDNWIVGIGAFHGNPYDGHTLSATLDQVGRLTDWKVTDAYVDLGYRGHNYEGDAHINIVNYRTMKKLTRSVKRWFKRRAAIEPVFSHLKSGNRMARNYLKGTEGDQINALLCACGFNMRKLLAVFLLCRFFMQKIWSKYNDIDSFISRPFGRIQIYPF
jgi:IS5 family transposase